jgi:hypothetical protein
VPSPFLQIKNKLVNEPGGQGTSHSAFIVKEIAIVEAAGDSYGWEKIKTIFVLGKNA